MVGTPGDRPEGPPLSAETGLPTALDPSCDPGVDPDVLELVDRYLKSAPGGRERLVPLLLRVQRQLGCLPFDVQQHVASRLQLSPVQVGEVASFYDTFVTRPRARYCVKVCMGPTCRVRRAAQVRETLRQSLGIEVGATSRDRLLGLEEVRCLGVCGLSPVMLVNEEIHGRLTGETVQHLARWLRGSGPALGREP